LKLKKAVRIENQVLEELKVEKHPDKTFIGKTEKGFTFLGNFIKPQKDDPSIKNTEIENIEINNKI
tara:strand:- start:55 stop:252 length:198 start_codon:yes stop_codon:yes gene_type:complete